MTRTTGSPPPRQARPAVGEQPPAGGIAPRPPAQAGLATAERIRHCLWCGHIRPDGWRCCCMIAHYLMPVLRTRGPRLHDPGPLHRLRPAGAGSRARLGCTTDHLSLARRDGMSARSSGPPRASGDHVDDRLRFSSPAWASRAIPLGQETSPSPAERPSAAVPGIANLRAGPGLPGSGLGGRPRVGIAARRLNEPPAVAEVGRGAQGPELLHAWDHELDGGSRQDAVAGDRIAPAPQGRNCGQAGIRNSRTVDDRSCGGWGKSGPPGPPRTGDISARG